MSTTSVLTRSTFLGLCLVLGRMSSGAIVSWDGGGENDLWSTAANWENDTVPTSTDEVHITLAGTYTVTLNVDATVASLTLGNATGAQTLEVTTTRTLTVSGNVTNLDTLAISGVLTVLNSGVVDLTQGTQNVLGILRVNGGTTRMGPGTSNTGGGTVELAGTHVLEIDGSYTEQPAPAASLVLGGSVSVTAAGMAATLTNNDALTITCDDAIDASVAVVNNNQFTIGAGANCTTFIDGPFSNPPGSTLTIIN
ncbi:MAG: hypothetical protein ACYTHJ_17470, partial [Planctomycetota bacterium]